VTRCVAIALFLLSLTATAQAQTLNCQQPDSDIDRATCRSADLMTARGSVGVAYEGLLHSLSGQAREHLIADQERWIRGSQSLCVESIRRFTTLRVDTQVAACLAERMSARTGRLLAMPSGGDYPFISDQLSLKAGLAARSTYRLFASYPRFDRPGIDNKALNQQIERSANERVGVGPFPTPGDSYPGPWRVEVRHDLRFPVRGVAAVLYSDFAQLDSVPPRSISLGMLVDLAAGKALGVDDVFTEGWRQIVPALCLEDMRRNPNGVPGEGRLVEMLSEPNRWLFGREGVEIVFRFYEEGATSTSARLVAIPYAKLKDVIRRDGPLADKAR
jgi:uncharacterized protein YecT (DUF1311 family)